MRLTPSGLPRLASSFVFACALAAVSACNLHFSTGVEAKDTWTRSYSVKPGATVELRETNGRILVEAVEGDRVDVVATRVAKGPSDEAAKAALASFTIAESATPDRVAIDSTATDGSLSFRLSKRVDYDVKMPRSGNLTVKTTNGEITVRAIAGFVKVETVNGDIELTGLERGADVSAINGRVRLELASVGENGIRCKTTNGQIIVTLPSGAKATLAARVTNGVVHTENLAIQATEESRRRLDATIGGGGPEIRLDTTNGEIRIVGKQDQE